MALYDRPAELRRRMAGLIRRFFDEHYQKKMAERLPALERSVAAHRGEHLPDAEALARKLTGKPKSCLEAGCAGPYERHIFVLSMDMGVYNSCAVVDGVHGLYYQLEPEFRGAAADEADDTRLARIYKALGDEQRLKILSLLREREMYAQEIVERTGNPRVRRVASPVVHEGGRARRPEAREQHEVLPPERGHPRTTEQDTRSVLRRYAGVRSK